MPLKLNSFIFKRMNVRDSGGDIAFYKIWIDRWEEDRVPVEKGKLIFLLSANYSVELENKLLGDRRGLVDLPIDVVFIKSVVQVVNGSKFILNLTLPRVKLADKHVPLLASTLENYLEQGFLFSVDIKLMRKYPQAYKIVEKYANYIYTENSPVNREDKLIIFCGENSSITEYDFFCEGEYEDVVIINALKYTQATVSKLISLFSEDASLEEIAKNLKGDPALVTKLLQYVNSPIFPHRKEIESVNMAASYLGLDNLKKFLMAVWMSQFFGQDPAFVEFIKEMLFNAFLLESFSKYVSVPRGMLFLAGLFYKMPEAFGVRPQVFFQSVAIPEDIVSLYKDESLKPYLKILDLLGKEGLHEHLKTLGLNEDNFKKHLKYVRNSLSSLIS